MQLQTSALSGAVFILFNKKRNQVKLLLWEAMVFQCIINAWKKERMNCLTIAITKVI